MKDKRTRKLLKFYESDLEEVGEESLEKSVLYKHKTRNLELLIWTIWGTQELMI